MDDFFFHLDGGQKTEPLAPAAGLSVGAEAAAELQNSAGSPVPGIDGLELVGNCSKKVLGKKMGPFGQVAQT